MSVQGRRLNDEAECGLEPRELRETKINVSFNTIDGRCNTCTCICILDLHIHMFRQKYTGGGSTAQQELVPRRCAIYIYIYIY